jgi:integrase
MPRQAAGTFRERSGRTLASVPSPFGAKGRIERSFADQAAAQRWVNDCLSARADGRPYPDASNYQLRVAPVVKLRTAPRTFGEIAWAWWREVYVEDRRAQPHRRMSVETMLRRRIVPFFDAQLTSIDAMHRDHVRAFVRFLAGLEPIDIGEQPRRLAVVSAEEFTVNEAAVHCGVSTSMIRRYWLAERFPHAYRRDGRKEIVIPVGDLAAAGLLSGQPRPHTRAPHRALTKNTANGHLTIVRQIVEYAIANNEMDMDPTKGVATLPPNPDRTTYRAPTRKKVVFEYAMCVNVARHLHIHHVVAFWIQRVLGLRVGEVFGLHVGDIGDFGDVGLLSISRQGGKKLFAYDERGNIVRRDEVDHTKTSTSDRTVAVPLPLLELLRTYIAAYHTDTEGVVAHGARLILGMREPGIGGVNAYRTALNKAFAAEGLTYNELGFNASTHHLRASLGGELKHHLDIDEMIRSEILGHLVRAQDGGSAVTVRSYTPALPQLEPFVAVAKVQGTFITDQIGSLCKPITRPHPLGNVVYLDAGRLAAARSVLETAGLLPTETGLVPFPEAAQIVGVSRQVIDRAVTAGKLTAVTVEQPVGGPVRLLSLDEVLAFKLERQPAGDHITSEEAAQLLAISQWSLVRLVKLGAIVGTRQSNNRFLVSKADVEGRRERLVRLAALQERAVRVGEAAARLHLSTDATKRLLRAGRLERDAESDLDPVGGHYITVASIERYEEQTLARATRIRRSEMLPDDWLPLEDLIAASGKNRVELLALSGKGLILKRDLKYRFYVHRESPLLAVLITAEQ